MPDWEGLGECVVVDRGEVGAIPPEHLAHIAPVAFTDIDMRGVVRFAASGMICVRQHGRQYCRRLPWPEKLDRRKSPEILDSVKGHLGQVNDIQRLSIP